MIKIREKILRFALLSPPPSPHFYREPLTFLTFIPVSKQKCSTTSCSIQLTLRCLGASVDELATQSDVEWTIIVKSEVEM